jgi:hypothetical protein
MADNSELAGLGTAMAAQAPTASRAPRNNPVFTGDFTHTGSKFGVNGATPVARAAAITVPASPGATYVQAEVVALRTAISSIITALKNAGITL